MANLSGVSSETIWILMNLAIYAAIFLIVGLAVAAWLRRGRQLDRIESELRSQNRAQDRILP